MRRSRVRPGDTMSDYHHSHDDPQPAYPKHCPACGATVHPLHITEPPYPKNGGRMPEMHEIPWVWRARCWNGHSVMELAEQLSLV